MALPLHLPAVGAEGFPAGSLPFVSPTSFVYACGNALRFASVDGEDEEVGVQEFRWGLGCGVTALAASTRHGVVAYAERMKTIHPPKVFLLSLDSKQKIATLSLDGDLGVVCIDIARDATRLCILSDVPDHTIVVWDWIEDKVLARTSARASRATSVSFSPTDPNVMCSSGGKIELWELVASEAGDDDFLLADPVVNIEQEDREMTCHCWGVGDTVFAGSDSGEIVQINARTGKRSAGSNWLAVCDGPVTAMSLTLKHVVVGSGDGQVVWVQTQGGNLALGLSSPWVHGGVCSISFSPGYETMVLGSTAGAVYQVELPRDLLMCSPEWSVGEAEGEEQQLEADLIAGFHDGPFVSIESFEDIPVAVTAGERGVITVWRLPTLSPISSTVASSTTPLTCLSLSPQSRAMAVGTKSGNLIVYDLSDLSSPRCVHRSRLHASPCVSVTFTPNMICTAAENGTMAFTSVGEQGVTPLGWVQVNSPLRCACLLTAGGGGAGSVLAATSDGRLIRFGVPLASELTAAASTGTAFAPSRIEETQVNGGPIISFKASPDCAWAVCACADRGVRAFDISASPPKETASWSEAQSRCNALAISGSGFVALGFADGGIVSGKSDANNLKPGADPLVAYDHSRGGVKALCPGRGALEGWLFSAGGDGCILSHAPSDGATRTVAQFAALQAGTLSVLGEEEEGDELASGEEGGGDGGGPVFFERRKIAIVGAGAAAGAGERGAEGKAMADKFGEIRARLAELLADNESRPEEERVDRGDICVDVGERERLVKMGDVRAAQVREATEAENAKKDAIALRIRQECYDSLDAHELTLVPFGGGHGVSSYPLPRPRPEDETRLERVKVMRRIELRELSAAAAEGRMGPAEDMVMSPEEWARVREERGEGKQGVGAKSSAAAAGGEEGEGVGGGEGGEGGAGAEGGPVGVDAAGENLLYSDMQLSKRENRINQVELLKERLRSVRSRFNGRVKSLINEKGKEMDKVDEKNSRLLEIIEELRVSEEVIKLKHAPTEQEGWQLSVDDSEIKVAKYMNAKERAELEKVRLEEEARKKASDKDDAVARALDGMMGGTLEVRKVDDSIVDLEKPVFYDDEGLSDEQIKACREYDKRLQVYEEERDKQRRALETEAKKIRAEIQALLDAFDARVQALGDDKLAVDAEIHQIELQVALLLDSLVKEEDLAMHILRLQKLAENAQDDLRNAEAAVSSFKEELDAFREVYENVLNEDKAHDKSLRRELGEDAGIHFEVLSKLWRKRTYAASDDSVAGEQEVVSLDPFASAGGEGVNLPRPEPLEGVWPNGLQEPPEDLDDEVIERFMEMRETKIDLELEVKKMATKLLQLNQRLQELTQVMSDSQAQCEQAEEDLEKVIEEGAANEHDLVLLFKVKQGCVEIDLETLMDESSDAALVEASTIVSLNGKVRELGTDKVATMKDSKEFKSKIHATNWETEVLDFRAEEVADNTRFYQLLWVTKDLQATIKGGDEGRKAAENSTLEKQMQHSKKLHALKVEDMKKRLFKGHKQIREKELENGKLDDYVQDLAVSVAQREKIIRVRESDKGAVDEQDYKMQEIVWRRLVLEEAKQQSEDIAILKAEVDRLRQRTFPSFAKSYAARNGL